MPENDTPVDAKPGYLTTEFLFGVLVVVCATVLLALDDIDQDSWKWAVTTVGGAYILSRGLVKGTANTATAKLADFKSDLAAYSANEALIAATTEPAQPTSVTNVAVVSSDPGAVDTSVSEQPAEPPAAPVARARKRG